MQQTSGGASVIDLIIKILNKPTILNKNPSQDRKFEVPMKRILLTTIGGMVLAAGPVLAADLPSRKAPPVAPVVYAPVFTWTGFYVGINAGGAWTGNNNNNLLPYGFAPSNGTLPTYVSLASLYNYNNNNNNNSGFTGGIQAGYNYQIGSFVVGAEADINYLEHNNHRALYTSPFFYGDPAGPAAGGIVGGLGDPFSGYYQVLAGNNNNNNNNYFGTVRARLGWAIDRALLYVTGGLAYGAQNYNRAGYVAYWAQPRAIAPIVGPVGNPTFYYGFGNGFYNNNNNNNIGWTVGAGAEYAFTNNWTVKLEYLYAQSGNNNNRNVFYAPASYTIPIGGVATLITLPGGHYFSTGKSNNDVNIVRVGLNYKF
jgi:outer membrane immunogenic protein